MRIAGNDGTTTEITGTDVVLAAGSVPRTIPGFDIDGTVVMTSDEVLALDGSRRRWRSSAAGPSAASSPRCSPTSAPSVTVFEALPHHPERLRRRRGQDGGPVVPQAGHRRQGRRDSCTGHTPDPAGRGTVVSYGDGEKLEVDAVVVSVGRRPRTEGLLADGTGVVVDDRGFVVTDETMRTAADGVWAVGDVVAGTPQLAHVGFAEAIVVVKCILGEPVLPVDYARVPWAIYCHPEVAFAGLTEAAAREAGFDVVVKKDPFGGNSRARIIGDTEGLVKVVAERPAGRRRPEGSSASTWSARGSPSSSAPGYLAVNWEATADEVAQFIQPHPSLSETFGETVLALTGRGLHVA